MTKSIYVEFTEAQIPLLLNSLADVHRQLGKLIEHVHLEANRQAEAAKAAEDADEDPQ